MRILRVITHLDNGGGAETSTIIEVEELVCRGHDVMVVTVASPPIPEVANRLDFAGITSRHLSGRLPVQAYRLRRLLKGWKPDVVHAVIFQSELVVALAMMRSKVVSLVSLVNMQYAPAAVADAPSPRRLELVRRLESLVLRHGIDSFVCLTQAGKRHSIEHLGIDPALIRVIPRGRKRETFDVSDEEVSQVRKEFSAEDRPLILNIGRHETQKGQELLIDALKSLADSGLPTRTVIAGRRGNQSSALQARVHRYGLAESIAMPGTRDDVPMLLAAADVVCVTSRWEGLGGSIIEAMAAGSAVVAFGIPAVSEAIGDAGVLVQPFDVSRFADAVRGLLNDNALRQVLASRAVNRFDSQFEISGVVDRIESLYEELSDLQLT